MSWNDTCHLWADAQKTQWRRMHGAFACQQGCLPLHTWPVVTLESAPTSQSPSLSHARHAVRENQANLSDHRVRLLVQHNVTYLTNIPVIHHLIDLGIFSFTLVVGVEYNSTPKHYSLHLLYVLSSLKALISFHNFNYQCYDLPTPPLIQPTPLFWPSHSMFSYIYQKLTCPNVFTRYLSLGYIFLQGPCQRSSSPWNYFKRSLQPQIISC